MWKVLVATTWSQRWLGLPSATEIPAAHLRAARDGERAALTEVVLDVDDYQCSHANSFGRRLLRAPG